ncbi:MAG: FKBP-type peptidyl-prolyl cis-trans isomerase [Nitrospiria bacterium]
MVRSLVAIVGLALAAPLAQAQDKIKLTTDKEKVGYSIGLDIGSNLKRQSVDLDPKAIAAGIADGMSGGKPLLSPEEIEKVMTGFRQQMGQRAEEEGRRMGEKNQKEGDAFLAQNKKKKGVVTLPSGLQYTVLKEGTGKTPKATDTVETHYRGTLIDGTEFDSSYKRGEPASFPVTGVIPGWTEALQLMKVGSKWQLAVPSTLAYGAKGAGPQIGPNTTLIFEVELLSIK